MNYEDENSNQQHHDDGEMNHDVDDSTYQQPLSCDSGKYHNGLEDECVDGNLPFSGLDDNSLVEEVRDVTQHQGKPAIQNTSYHQANKSL